jgi:acetyl esterase/lipase
MRFIPALVLYLLGYGSLFTASAQTEPAYRQETYKRGDSFSLAIDIFDPPAKDPGKKYPAIVLFFGGGWTGGTPTQFHKQCEYLASRGVVAMSANYRVKSRHGTSPRECVKDGKSAVRWIRSNASRLGIDPDRIAAGGGSAGGHVAAAVATVSGFEEEGEDGTISCIPNALVLFNPVFDNSPNGYGHAVVRDMFPSISPLHNLKAGNPPTIVFLGTEDNLIPVETARAYQSKMRSLGNRCELHLYEGQPHGFFNLNRPEKAYFYRTLLETDKFLASLGWVSGDPKISPELLATSSKPAAPENKHVPSEAGQPPSPTAPPGKREKQR